MRDLVLVTLFFPMLPFAFLYPWIGVLVWSWIGYMNPHRLTFGFAYDMPFGLIAALTTMAGMIFSRERKRLPRGREVILVLALWAWFTVTAVFAFHPELAWDKWQQVSKILLMTMVTMVLFKDARRLKWLVWTIAASLGFYGVQSALGAIASGFAQGYAYPPDSFIADNNDMALALNMTLPLLWFLARDTKHRWLSIGLRVAFVLTMLGIITTYSRGGFVGLCAVVIVMLMKAKRRGVAAVLVAAAVIVAIAVVPDTLSQRIGTIVAYEEDESAQNRLRAWAVAIQVALDSPIVGGGFRVFEPDVWERYDPDIPRAWTAHSIYLQVVAEHGFVGLGIFVTLLAVALLGARRVRIRAATLGELQIADLAAMVQASLVGYMVSGAFASRADFDLFYHLVAIIVVMQFLVTRASESASSESAEPASASSFELATRQPRALPERS
ncbi:MAG: putative O-glycosylation ligase, exosortase A system-associated [Candidatus Rokuibacteriota bacterium]|nr:MAG: putative O-glycosylation ligase, exosortase A system-associated [Candidatus Rokubacteria bacterium]